ncbi:hypothetical protein [Acidianus sp. HS-5]|uniref:hypothetical protein n=1 Tax=Acidianus sp. HS-5 TaxID=2886040 RepID=UPI001F25CDFB|nr:hypothetical protein [Acidianus sp. HS-5]BDC17695.1 hypothetical protein HS5_05850 [Acidianus sp. HS-5]
MKVTIKGVDERLYKMLKAKASIEGISVSEAINKAIKLWLVNKDLDRLMVIKSKEFWDAVNDGKYALFCDGNFIGGFDSEEGMIKEARKYKKCYALSKKWLIEEGEVTGVL